MYNLHSVLGIVGERYFICNIHWAVVMKAVWSCKDGVLLLLVQNSKYFLQFCRGMVILNLHHLYWYNSSIICQLCCIRIYQQKSSLRSSFHRDSYRPMKILFLYSPIYINYSTGTMGLSGLTKGLIYLDKRKNLKNPFFMDISPSWKERTVLWNFV